MKRIGSIFLLLFCFVGLQAQVPKTALDSLPLPDFKDDPILAMLDSFAIEQFYEQECVVSRYPQVVPYLFPTDSVPRYSDSIYQARLEVLDRATPFDLEFNRHVKAFIDLYVVRKREQVERMMGLTEMYFPLFENMLDKYEMPLELKYLAIVESALNTRARSRAGAVGLWQFMYSTGRLYGLHSTSYVDDRMDPYKATEAACKYLKFLHGMFDDWDLALAAYNCGPGRVNRAIRRSGGKKDYWQLWPYLPRETRGYVPAFIAVNYVMNHTAEHNMFSCAPRAHFYEVDTVAVKQGIQFEQIAKVLDMDMELLRFLNPTYKHDFIPHRPEKPYMLTLTLDKMGAFVSNEQEIYDYFKIQDSILGEQAPKMEELVFTHTVRRGEYLGKIASRYGVSIRSLKEWNNLRSNNLRIGQKLVIHQKKMVKPGTPKTAVASAATKPKPTTTKTTTTPPPKPAPDNTKYKYHVIQSGDTLWDLAIANGVTVTQLRQWNNLSRRAVLKPGRKLKIGIDKG